MTISSPVGTVTTFQFNPSGTIEDWTVPFHDGPMEVLCIGGAGSRQGPVPNGSGGRRDHASPVAVNQAGGS